MSARIVHCFTCQETNPQSCQDIVQFKRSLTGEEYDAIIDKDGVGTGEYIYWPESCTMKEKGCCNLRHVTFPNRMLGKAGLKITEARIAETDYSFVPVSEMLRDRSFCDLWVAYGGDVDGFLNTATRSVIGPMDRRDVADINLGVASEPRRQKSELIRTLSKPRNEIWSPVCGPALIDFPSDSGTGLVGLAIREKGTGRLLVGGTLEITALRVVTRKVFFDPADPAARRASPLKHCMAIGWKLADQLGLDYCPSYFDPINPKLTYKSQSRTWKKEAYKWLQDHL